MQLAEVNHMRSPHSFSYIIPAIKLRLLPMAYLLGWGVSIKGLNVGCEYKLPSIGLCDDRTAMIEIGVLLFSRV